MATIRICIRDIKKDTSKFQFRKVDFDPKRVEWLVENWDENSVDPLDVWQQGNDYYLISGHHRLEAMERLQIESAECRVHQCSEEDAQLLAMKSNANRLEYTDFEWSRIVTFLVQQGNSFTDCQKELAIELGQVKRYYYLRHLVGTDWERQYIPLDLKGRAGALAEFCEKNPLSVLELQSLFEVAINQHDLSTTQIKQLLKDVLKQKARETTDTGTLFDIADFSSRIITTVKERNFLDQCAAQSWWLYELLHKNQEHKFPPELKAEFTTALRKFYAYCVDAEEEEITPTRASGKDGRKLRLARPKAS